MKKKIELSRKRPAAKVRKAFAKLMICQMDVTQEAALLGESVSKHTLTVPTPMVEAALAYYRALMRWTKLTQQY